MTSTSRCRTPRRVLAAPSSSVTMMCTLMTPTLLHQAVAQRTRTLAMKLCTATTTAGQRLLATAPTGSSLPAIRKRTAKLHNALT